MRVENIVFCASDPMNVSETTHYLNKCPFLIMCLPRQHKEALKDEFVEGNYQVGRVQPPLIPTDIYLCFWRALIYLSLI